MPEGLDTLLAVAGAGAIASLLGGAAALWKKPTTLTLSIAAGFAAGALLGTFAFEMLPKAAAFASLTSAIGGFAAGFALFYGLDLFVHRGVSAGEQAEQWQWVMRKRHTRPARGDVVTVLAGGTSAEELVEGITIGVSAAIDPSLAMIIGLAIAIDNFAESLSIGELVFACRSDRPARRILLWTGLIGFSLFVSAFAGWLLLREMSSATLGFLIAAGAGGMFYLTIADLVPEAEKRHFNQSSAVATAAGFLLMFALSKVGQA